MLDIKQSSKTPTFPSQDQQVTFPDVIVKVCASTEIADFACTGGMPGKKRPLP